MPLPGALYTQPLIDPKSGLVSRPWLLFFNSLASGTGVAAAPADAEYIVAVANGVLTAERVATDTATVAWDFTTPGQAKANVPDDSITYAKMQDVSAASVLLGHGSILGAGEIEEITLDSSLTMSGTTLSVSGAVTSGASGFAHEFLLMGG